MNECVFCRIASGQIEARVVDEGEEWLAFHDVNPQAPAHVLVIPREHIATANDLKAEHDALIGKLVRAAGDIARRQGVADEGYRVVLNCNAGAGQSVFHLHLHVLGGRPFRWPPG